MKLVVVAAGFTPGEADQLRRAMAAWKRTGVINQFEQKLIQGMLANGYSEEFARNLFGQIEGFGSYGFPESHAASFALLVYVSAWIKCHHPAVFLAALLNSQPMGFYGPAQLVADARRAWCRGPSGRRQSERLRLHARASGRRWQAGRAARLVDGQGVVADRGARRWSASARAGPFTTYGDFVGTHRLHDRRSCLDWRRPMRSARSVSRAGRPTGCRWPRPRPSPCSPIFADEDPPPLPRLSPAQEVIHDYHAQGLSLRGHPFAPLRTSLEAQRVVTASALKDIESPTGVIASPGLVLVRQRPANRQGNDLHDARR